MTDPQRQRIYTKETAKGKGEVKNEIKVRGERTGHRKTNREVSRKWRSFLWGEEGRSLKERKPDKNMKVKYNMIEMRRTRLYEGEDGKKDEERRF